MVEAWGCERMKVTKNEKYNMGLYIKEPFKGQSSSLSV